VPGEIEDPGRNDEPREIGPRRRGEAWRIQLPVRDVDPHR